VRFLYALLIYATVALGIATVWAVGRDVRAESELRRAQDLAAIPQFNHEFAAASPGTPDAPDAAATRPAPPVSESDAPRRTVRADAFDLAQ
jgi:hypothetical protein